ncbi:unnamed protein product [Heterosigma akashiwo]
MGLLLCAILLVLLGESRVAFAFKGPKASAGLKRLGGSVYSPNSLHMLWGNTKKATKKEPPAAAAEAALLETLAALTRRGAGADAAAAERVAEQVAVLERTQGIPDPADYPGLNGRWRLLHTTTPGTASPIQRSFVGAAAFSVFQDIDLASPDRPTVANVVEFGSLGVLTVEALASTAARPLPGFVPRRGDGKILGLNIFGVSSTEPPANPKQRIDFKFDYAAFDFNFLPFAIPYPVPFRYLGDEVTGWIDITYLSESLRIARGNKGTTFILQKEEEK